MPGAPDYVKYLKLVNPVVAAEIADGSITTAKLADGAVTDVKISGRLSLAKMPAAASGVLKGKGAAVDPAYEALVAGDLPAEAVLTNVAKTITAQHTFNPGAAGAPFLLGANASGQLVTGLNADTVDGKHASELAPAYYSSVLTANFTTTSTTWVDTGLSVTPAAGSLVLAMAQLCHTHNTVNTNNFFRLYSTLSAVTGRTVKHTVTAAGYWFMAPAFEFFLNPTGTAAVKVQMLTEAGTANLLYLYSSFLALKW